MTHYYGGNHGPITKVDVGIFIAMNIFWILGWLLSLIRWFLLYRRHNSTWSEFTLFDYRWNDLRGMLLSMIDMAMGIFWVGVVFGVVGTFISKLL